MTLKDAREMLGWTQARLAEEAGEAASTISDIELGRNARPAYEVVMNIYLALWRAGLKGLAVTDIFPVRSRAAHKHEPQIVARTRDREPQVATR